jgi:hypothetical protein
MPETPEPKIVLVWDDGSVTLSSMADFSYHYDLADCDAMDGVVGMYGVNENNKIVEITVAESVPVNTDQEYPFYYAASAVLAGERRLGSVTYTDH